MGTKFTVYDNGGNPSKNTGTLLEESAMRQELAAICYVSGFCRLFFFLWVKLSLYFVLFFFRKPTYWDSKDHVK